MDDHDDLIERLQRLGRQPVDPAVQSAHLRALTPAARSPLRSKLRIAGVFLAGLLVGGSGLAAAGALPDVAQNAAHNVLAEVGVQVPQPERYHDDAVCGGARGDRRNHGDYVRDDRSLAQTDCGKPVKGGPGGAGAKGERGPKASGERDACQGPPPWAGKGMTPEQKATAQAERAARCGADGETDETDEVERSERDGAPPADAAVPVEPTTTTTGPTTTTEPPSTTTGAEVTTTTVAG